MSTTTRIKYLSIATIVTAGIFMLFIALLLVNPRII